MRTKDPLLAAFHEYRATLLRAQQKPRTARDVAAYFAAAMHWSKLRARAPERARALEGGAR